MKKIILITLFVIMSSGAFVLADQFNTDNWRYLINKKVETEFHYKQIRPKLDVYLYYEIYDAFCRKYKYEYKRHSYKKKVPARVEVSSRDLSSESDYRNFYDRYKDYISGAKSPNSEFIEARRKLEEKDIQATFIPESEVTESYWYLDVKATDAQQRKEVDKVWNAKKGKVMPKPYSLEKELDNYKTLTKDDIKFVIKEFKNRLSTTKIIYSDSQGGISEIHSNNLDKEAEADIQKAYQKCNGNLELFRVYARDIDKKYEKYYPQNL